MLVPLGGHLGGWGPGFKYSRQAKEGGSPGGEEEGQPSGWPHWGNYNSGDSNYDSDDSNDSIDYFRESS